MICSYRCPYGLMRNWSSVPGTRSEMIVDEVRRLSEARGCELPILMICEWREDFQAKVDDYITRPVDAHVLLGKVREMLDGPAPATVGHRSAPGR